LIDTSFAMEPSSCARLVNSVFWTPSYKAYYDIVVISYYLFSEVISIDYPGYPLIWEVKERS